MCSVFGFIRPARHSSTAHIQTLIDIAKANLSRGPDAFGFAWVDDENKLRAFKSAGRIVDHLPTLAMVASNARMLIGHLRWSTHGSPSDNANNHPHNADGGYIVHNGVIGNYRQLIERNELLASTDCDSEVLGLLIEQNKGKLIRRAADAVNAAEESAPLTMLGLWHGEMMVARRGNPLHSARANGGIYFASLAKGLPGAVREFHDERIARYTPDGKSSHVETLNARKVIAWDYSRRDHAGRIIERLERVERIERETQPRGGVSRGYTFPQSESAYLRAIRK